VEPALQTDSDSSQAVGVQPTGQPSVVVVMPAYNAALTLERTYDDIPHDIVHHIILVDDVSQDETVDIAHHLGLDVAVHKQNRGYGGNQKTCYDRALEMGADIIIMLHPDYQYDATPVAGELADGARVQVGDLVVEAVATPGHSVGHMAYFVHDGVRSDLFTGDTLFFGGRIALQNIWDCDLRTHLESLKRLGEHRFDGLFPGHLTFTVTEGERHLRIALDAIDRGGIPPVL